MYQMEIRKAVVVSLRQRRDDSTRLDELMTRTTACNFVSVDQCSASVHHSASGIEISRISYFSRLPAYILTEQIVTRATFLHHEADVTILIT